MERLKRRLWTMLTIALAGVVIAATLISGLFQIAVYMLPAYRDDLAVWVTEVAARPVQIGGISLVWRGAAPRLDLTDITLYGEVGSDAAERSVLSAERLSLGISLWRLLRLDLRPSRIELAGLALALRLDEHGDLTLIGFESDEGFSPEAAEKWLRQLENFRALRLSNCTVLLETPTPGALRFTLASFDATRTGNGFEAEAELRLPPAYGEELRFEAAIEGPIAKPLQWRGTLGGSADGLQPQPWLRGRVLPGTAAGVDQAEAEFEGRIDGGRLEALALRLAAENFIMTRAGVEQAAAAADATVSLTRGSQGWRVELQALRLDEQPQLQGTLHYAGIDGGYELGANAALLRLDRLAPWLRYVDALGTARAEQLAGLRGELRELDLLLRQDAQGRRYGGRVDLAALGLPPGAQGYGVTGLSGRVQLTEDGGSLELAPGPLQARLPPLATPELPIDSLSGTLAWTRRDQGWRLSMPQFAWAIGGSRGSGQFSLDWPADSARAPKLDLAARFSAADINALKPWMPLAWGDALRAWLRRGVVGGRVEAGTLAIRGPLDEFPFEATGSGEWHLDVAVADGRLDYAPGWPPLQRLKAELAFRGNGLTIHAQEGEIGGNPIDSASARFVDFRDRLLLVDGAVSGETSDFYRFLRGSPVAAQLAALLKNTSAAGPSRVGLHLEIPLRDQAEVAVSGTVALDGVQMYYRSLADPINDIRGTLAFDAEGIRAEQLSAQFADVALKARIEPRDGTEGVVIAEFPYAINARGEGLSAWVPEAVRRNVAGSALYRAELPLGVEDAALKLSSDLKGLDVRLPAPLAKRAAEPAALRVLIGGAQDSAAPLRVGIEYEQRLGADIAMQTSGKQLEPVGINLRLGAGEPPPRALDGLRLRGNVAELDIAAWTGVLAGAESRGLALKEAEMSAARWIYRNQVVRNVRAILSPAADGWDARLDGAGAEGTLSYRKADGGRLAAQLARLSVELPLLKESVDAAPAASIASAETPLDPSAWPLLDLAVGQLGVNESNFGALQLRSARAAGSGRGQKLEQLKLNGGVVDAEAGGEWLRDNGASSARLTFNASSSDVAGLLKSLGFAPNLAAKQSRVNADLVWDAAAAGLDWTQARGHIDLAFENGTLKAVEPGAGRVLGLLNFYALPRRLSLDFRDVLSAGLGFDRIAGGFDLGGGSAVTENVSIRATSLRMELRGRVGLAARDYDQRVTVFPDVSPGVTLGAALLGGPAAAAIAFLAQEVLEKPLDQVTQFSYRLTGSWDNPQLRRIDSGAKAEQPVGSTRPRN